MDNIDISIGDDIQIGQEPGVIIDENNNYETSSESIIGPPGPQGEPGFSPIANVTQTASGATITITDQEGTTSANVFNGTDGVSPRAYVNQTADGATITIVDSQGTTSAVINNGDDGEPGDNATISVGSTSTLAPGSQATVQNTGTPTNAVLSFGIPMGAKGDKGDKGNPGINAQAYVTQNTGSATITIEDADGITTATVYDGQDGTPGADGYSPSATVTPTASGATISITDQQGTTTANITNGTDGTDGVDGFSPTATVTQNTGSATISITDKNGTTTATVNDGQNGTDGTSASITVGSTTTGTPGTLASVTNSGTSTNAILDFTIPAGFTPILTAGPTTTGNPGTNASVTRTGSDIMPIFNFTIPRGDTGATGPAGQGVVDYSTNEVNTGIKWVDGSTLYRKVINFGALPNASEKSVAHGVSGIRIHSLTGIARNPNSGITFILPTLSTSFGACITMYADSTNIHINTQSTDRSSYTECYVILEYTKAS